MKDTVIGIDLAKIVFQLHGTSMTGEVKLRKKLLRGQFLRFMSEQHPALVVMEACGGTHHWAHGLVELGHEVKLIVPLYVRPFVKRSLGRISKSGQVDIRRLLIIGAMSRLTWRGQKGIAKRSWLARLIATGKPLMLIAIALANKMAREVWAMMTKEEDYQDPSLVAVA